MNHKIIILTIFLVFTNSWCLEVKRKKTVNLDNGLSVKISQFGITWFFDKIYKYGQFTNGDYYVVDPGNGVKIVGISPRPSTYNGYDINGSEKNPIAGTSTQGYDSQLGRYTSKLNAAIGVSSSNPLVLVANDCLISSISNTPPKKHNYGGQLTVMNTCAILTCVSEAPLEGTFRPSYCDRGLNKLYNINELDYGLLKKSTQPLKLHP